MNMNRNKQQNKQSITPMQKQALWVCGLCAVAVLLTAGITLTKLAQGKYQPPASSEPAPVSYTHLDVYKRQALR